MVLRHTHTERHRGLVPSDQLGAADGTAGWVLTDDGAGFGEWMAATGGSAVIVAQVSPVGAVDIAGGDLDGPGYAFDTDNIGGIGSGDRIFVKDGGPTAVDNGVWVLTAGAPVRATDQDTAAEIEGALIVVQQGDKYGKTLWRNTNLSTPTVGVSNLTYAPLHGRLDQVLRNGNDTQGQLIVGTDSGGSTGASLDIGVAIGAAGGATHLKGGDGSGGATGGDFTAFGGSGSSGGEVDATGGTGAAGDPGGAVYVYGGSGDGGADDGAGIDLNPGDGAGNPGKVSIYTDATNGAAYQVLTSDATYATWQDIDGGSA